MKKAYILLLSIAGIVASLQATSIPINNRLRQNVFVRPIYGTPGMIGFIGGQGVTLPSKESGSVALEELGQSLIGLEIWDLDDVKKVEAKIKAEQSKVAQNS